MILAFCVIVFGIGCWWFFGWLGTFFYAFSCFGMLWGFAWELVMVYFL